MLFRSLEETAASLSRDFVTKEFLDLHRLDELKNFAANIFLKLMSKSHTGIRASNWLVTY